MTYNLLMHGGTRHGEILPVTRLEPSYALWVKTPRPIREPAKQVIHEKVPVEYYFLERFSLRMLDCVWEYFVLIHGDLLKPHRELDIAYRINLSDTYVRRHYSKSYAEQFSRSC